MLSGLTYPFNRLRVSQPVHRQNHAQVVARPAAAPLRARGSSAQDTHECPDQGIPTPFKLTRKPRDALYQADRERNYTVLTIDGGGMRGMIPACVLEEVETAIKEKAVALLKETLKVDAAAADVEQQKAERLLRFQDKFDMQPMPTDADIAKLTHDHIHVDLADFFDLISGTSTGAILAAYLATKGGNCRSSILESTDPQYVKEIDKFMDIRQKATKSNKIDAGTATAAQAMFAAAGDQIFTKGWGLNPGGLAKSKYRSKGIEDVLSKLLRDPSVDTPIKLSDDKSLHCSLLIPSFQIDHNRPVMFWHLHQDEAVGGSSWGYSTVNRLRPFEGIEAVDSTEIVTAVAGALAGPGPFGSKPTKAFPAKTADAALLFSKDAINDTVLTNWDPEYPTTLAKAVCKTLPRLEGFDQGDLVQVIKHALVLLDSEQFDSFGEALRAAIIPELRPDMLTSMYVLKTPSPAEEAAAAAAAAAEPTTWVEKSAKAVSDNATAALQASSELLAKLKAKAAAGLYGAGAGGGLGPLIQMQGGPVAVPLPRAFRFYEAQCGDSLHVYNVDFNLAEVVHASTAAPTFFTAASLASQGVGRPPRPMQLGGNTNKALLQGYFADGGVVANNPTMAAIAFLERAYGVHRSNIAVLSLGCGTVTGPVDVPENAGALSWALPLVSQVFMGSSIDTVTAVAEMMFTAETDIQGQQPAKKPSRYLRIQTVGFAPPEDGWLERLAAKLKLRKVQQPQLRMHTPAANS